MDDQVKIRGIRVEPGEPQRRLAEHPGVGHAVVVSRDDPARGRHLVGYVVPATGQPAPDPAELAEHLARTLPDYLVPAAIVVLDRLPLTANGKVDRAALPDPQPVDAPAGRPLTTRTEHEVARLADPAQG